MADACWAAAAGPYTPTDFLFVTRPRADNIQDSLHLMVSRGSRSSLKDKSAEDGSAEQLLRLNFSVKIGDETVDLVSEQCMQQAFGPVTAVKKSPQATHCYSN